MKGPTILTSMPGRIYAVGDVHGCMLELQALFSHLEQNGLLVKEDSIVFIGDVIDRGSSTREVIEFIIALKRRYPNTYTLKGNHEEMMLHYLDLGGVRGGPVWLKNGGTETLRSYGITRPDPLLAREIIPPEHLEFLQGLHRYIITDRYIFAHAGLSPVTDLLLQNDDDLFWIREEFIRNIHQFGKVVVFGHTPFRKVFVHAGYKIGIDTGLVYGNVLSAVELSSHTVYTVKSNRDIVNASPLETT